MLKPFALAAIALGLSASFASFPAPATAQEVAVDGDWSAKLNRRVVVADHWTWTLRHIERRGDELRLTLKFRNNGTSARPIFLDANFASSVALIEPGGNVRHDLVAVEGISGEMLRVDRKRSASAVFAFAYPENARSVRFVSRWVTILMAGAGRVIEVDFDLQLPPPEAKPR